MLPTADKIAQADVFCLFPDCDLEIHSRRLCKARYQEKRLGRAPVQVRRPTPPKSPTLKRRACDGTSEKCRTDHYYADPDGYRLQYHQWNHPNAQKDGRILEHILVMSEIIGRPLLPGENIHHRNGVRNDNRPENLELWVISQPAGQRPEDLVTWANEILARYQPLPGRYQELIENRDLTIPPLQAQTPRGTGKVVPS